MSLNNALNLSLEDLKTKFSYRDTLLEERAKLIQARDAEIKRLVEQLEWFKRQIFGKRSERVVANLNEFQMEFEGFENLDAPKELEKKEIPAHSRKKPNRNVQDAIGPPSDLPLQTPILDIPEEEMVCKKLGKLLSKLV